MTTNVHKLASLRLTDAMYLFGVTARALRYYEQQGLIRAHRDQRSARIYDSTARRRLEWIAPLRRLGIPLRDIKQVLDSEEHLKTKVAQRVLRKRQAAAEAQLEGITRYLAELSARSGNDQPSARSEAS